jgi:uncharacterized protein YqgV (UPF0045/DUF77 family)
MVMELTMTPFGSGRSLSSANTDLLKIIEGSGLDYRVATFGESMQGTWEELLYVANVVILRCEENPNVF